MESLAEHRRKRAATQHRLSEHVGQGLQNRDHLQARTARTLLAHNNPLRRRVEASTAAYLSPRPRIALRSWSTARRTSGPNTMEPRERDRAWPCFGVPALTGLA